MARSQQATERLERVALAAWATIGVAIVVVGVLWVLDKISAALVPFVLAGVVVLLLRSPVMWLEDRGIKRAWAVALCYIAAMGVLSIAGAFIVPALVDQAVQFFNKFPDYYGDVVGWWATMQGRFADVVVPTWVQSGFDQLSSAIAGQFGALGQALASGVISVGSATATFAFNLLLALVIAFWVLKDLPKMREEIMALVGEKRERDAEFLIDTVLRVLGGYVRGQFIISTVTGVIVWVGLAIAGVPYALILGMITGTLNIVPYVGPLIGGLISAVVAAFVSPLAVVWALVVTLAAQQATDLFVTPRVMSAQVDLHPVLVILSLLIGGTLLGFVGMVIAIPTAAVAKGLFIYYYERHTRRTISSRDGALFRSSGPCDDDRDGAGSDSRDSGERRDTTAERPAGEHGDPEERDE